MVEAKTVIGLWAGDCPGYPHVVLQVIWRRKEAVVELQLDSEGLRARGADVNPSPRAGEGQCPSSNRRQEEKWANSSFLRLCLCSIQARDRLSDAAPTGESSLLSSLIQMLIL